MFSLNGVTPLHGYPRATGHQIAERWTAMPPLAQNFEILFLEEFHQVSWIAEITGVVIAMKRRNCIWSAHAERW